MNGYVITGVSSGIGYGVAQALIEQGAHVFGSVRKDIDAQRLQDEWGERYTPLLFDVTDADAVRAGAALVAERVGDRGVAGLVNNAGISVPGPVLHLPLDDVRQQFEVNFFGVIAVTQAFLPLLGACRPCPHAPGRIVNISSVSGRVAYPFLSSYAASKHALEAWSDSLRRELMLYGIDVGVIEPGSVQTPIWDKADAHDTAHLRESDYYQILVNLQKETVARGRNALPVGVVVDAVLHALTASRPKTRYALPSRRISGWWLPRFAPTRWFDRQVAKRLGLLPPA